MSRSAGHSHASVAAGPQGFRVTTREGGDTEGEHIFPPFFYTN